VRCGKRPSHRDFAGVDAIGPLSLLSCRSPLIVETVLLVDPPFTGADGGRTGCGILRGGVCCSYDSDYSSYAQLFDLVRRAFV